MFDSFRALDALLGQMTSNMGEVTNLRLGLEDRLSKHVDVREALMKKKDEQLQGTMYIYVIVFLCSYNGFFCYLDSISIILFMNE